MSNCPAPFAVINNMEKDIKAFFIKSIYHEAKKGENSRFYHHSKWLKPAFPEQLKWELLLLVVTKLSVNLSSSS